MKTMIILISKKRIERLEERIRNLEDAVSDLREQSKFTIGWRTPPISVKTVVEKIMAHLNVEIDYQPAKAPDYILRTCKKKK